MFTSLNNLAQLEFLSSASAEELRDQIRSISLPVKIISIYMQGSQHIAWILTEAKIKKVKKGESKNGSGKKL